MLSEADIMAWIIPCPSTDCNYWHAGPKAGKDRAHRCGLSPVLSCPMWAQDSKLATCDQFQEKGGHCTKSYHMT